MPKLMNKDDNQDIIKVAGAGSFQFSAIRITDLADIASEFTLVTAVIDFTGSVGGFEKDLHKALVQIVEACKKSPRAENLLMRVVTFNYHNQICEVHGFKPLNTIDPAAYKLPVPSGMTALYDASYEAIAATLTYSESLIKQEFNCNACIYIITDGADNDSKIATPTSIKKKLGDSTKAEVIESLITVLVGINTQGCKDYLEDFQKDAGLTQYVDVDVATPQKLAKLAAFVSKSISSTSQALGTGAASQPLTF
jgi:uncharacterized protein YegL